MSTSNPQSLEALERVVCAAHASAVRCESGILDYALKAGDALLDIMRRKLVHHGDREKLFERTCGSKRTGQIYVQLAEHRSLIKEQRRRGSSLLSVAAALRLIRKSNKPKNSESSNKPPKSFSRWKDGELSAALDKLEPERLLQAASPAFRQKLATRFAGQQTKLITQIAADSPRLKAKDLPQLIDARREAQAQAMQDVGADSTAEAYRSQVAAETQARELQRLREKNDRLETRFEDPAELIKVLERLIPRSNCEAHKHLEALTVAIEQPLIITETREAARLH
jgi:hypothetical protein